MAAETRRNVEADTLEYEGAPATIIPSAELVSETKTETQDLEPERKIRGLKWAIVVFTILSNLLLYAIDNTIVAIVQPVIISQFGHVQDLPWVSVGFLMSGTATALLSGKLYGAFNAKHLYILNSLIFLVGSAMCGAAPNLSTLIVGRVIGGAGGTGMYLGALTLISVYTTPKETSAYMGYLALVWGFGSIIGPVIGGAFAESTASWRWGFYLNVVIVGICMIFYCVYLPSYDPRPNTALRPRLHNIDWLGSALSMGSLAVGIITINFCGTVYEWGSGSMNALIVVAVVALAILFLQQSYCIFTTKENRLMPLDLLRKKDMAICFACQVLVAVIVPIPLYFIPLFFELGKGDSAIHAAVKMLPLIIAWVTSSAIRGHLMPRTKWYQAWYVVGSGLNIVAGVLLSRISLSTPERYILVLEVVSGIGTGCFGQAGFAVAQRLVPKKMIHKSISLMLIAQLSGTTLGLAVGGSIFQNIIWARIHRLLPALSKGSISLLLAGAKGDLNNMLDSEQILLFKQTVVVASTDCYILIYAAAALSSICACFFTPRKLW